MSRLVASAPIRTSALPPPPTWLMPDETRDRGRRDVGERGRASERSDPGHVYEQDADGGRGAGTGAAGGGGRGDGATGRAEGRRGTGDAARGGGRPGREARGGHGGAGPRRRQRRPDSRRRAGSPGNDPVPGARRHFHHRLRPRRQDAPVRRLPPQRPIRRRRPRRALGRRHGQAPAPVPLETANRVRPTRRRRLFRRRQDGRRVLQ